MKWYLASLQACVSGLTAMVTERAKYQPASSTMVARTYTSVAYDAFAFCAGGGVYSPSGDIFAKRMSMLLSAVTPTTPFILRNGCSGFGE